MNSTIRTYEPDNSIKKGILRVFPEIISEVVRNRWLTYQLFKRDVFAVYKQSLIGIFWIFIIPLISIGTFMLLNNSGILTVGDISVPYPIFAIMGLAFWQIFSTGLIAGSNSLVKAGSMITKINFSKKSLIIASMGQSLISLAVQILLLSMLLILYGYKPNISILLFPLLILPLLLLTLGLNFILSLLNGLNRDISSVITVLMTFLMLLTPVLYDKPKIASLAVITRYNPLYYLISVPRNLMLSGHVNEWRGYIISSILSVVLLIICLIVFHLTETRIAERI